MLASKYIDAKRDGWLGWAIFLGISWTWCIGMFLPVLLVHDYGVWAWLVFAVPNVVGAAAMGWLIDAERSRLMVAAHRPAITAFSVVTVAFQVFFAVWAFTRPPWQSTGYRWYLIGVILVAIIAMVRTGSRLLAIAVVFASIVCAIGMFHRGEARITERGITENLSRHLTFAVEWLAPVCLFGFLLCPYLDSTFHRARQHLSNRDAKLSFGIGFGVIFFAAIVLSLLYAKPVHNAIDIWPPLPMRLHWIKIYWMIQLGFTIGVHLIGDDADHLGSRGQGAVYIAIAGLIGAIIALAIGARLSLRGETVYRAFLGFYALVFPAYVWICVLPGRFVRAPTRSSMYVFAIATLLAMPMFWTAFIGKQLGWAFPGVAVIVLSRLFISRKLSPQPLEIEPGDALQQNSAPTS